jgi:hypothetical protein
MGTWSVRLADRIASDSANEPAGCSAHADLERVKTANLADALPGLQPGLQL